MGVSAEFLPEFDAGDGGGAADFGADSGGQAGLEAA